MNLLKLACLTSLIGTMALMPITARADGARDWLNVPVNMNFVYLYYTYSNAETSINSPLPVDGAEVSAQVPILRYARSFDLGGRAAGIQLILPYAFIEAELTGTNVNRNIDGLGDMTAIFISNIFGAPALSREEFASWKPETFLTGALSVTMPTGSYDADRLVNAGKNRWAFKPQLSWGTPIGSATWLTANGMVQFFQDNDAYFGNSRLSQKPLATIEAHYSVNLNQAIWLSADAIFTTGGETAIDNVDKNNRQNTLRLGLSGNLNLTPVDAINVGFTTTVAKESYTADATTFQISYSKAW